MAILLAIGYLFKQTGFFSGEFLRVGKKLCFYVFLSCSLFKNLYDSSIGELPYRYVVFVCLAILLEALIAWPLAKMVSSKRNQIGVIIQGAFRSNFAYIGIPLANMFFSDALSLSEVNSKLSIVSIFTIPLFNVMAVLVLMAYGDKKDDAGLLKKTLSGITKNPCILSIVCGLIVLYFRRIVPGASFFIRDRLPFVYKALSYLSGMSTPFSFLLVGAGLNFSHSYSNRGKLILSVALRDLLFPGLILLGAYCFFDFDPAEYAIMVSVFASPAAVSSAIMAFEMGGDAKLADGIVVYTTLFSMFSLVMIIYCLKITGCV